MLPDTEAELRALDDDLKALEQWYDRNKLFAYYPDEGPLRRELYPKHTEFFRVGADYRQRCAMCANRVGKTEGMGGYETVIHLTGRYPDWWEGKRFHHPIEAWAAGKTNETTRDIIQAKLLGPPDKVSAWGTGLIPHSDLVGFTRKSGVTNLLDTIVVKHYDENEKQDGESVLGLKSYQQGRGSFEGTQKHVIWEDEEPPQDIHEECLIRTAGTKGDGSDDGIIMLTFTPLEGMSEVVMGFMPKEMRPDA